MSYQVLARKWRPKDFSEVVGQEHVVQALINSLDQNKLHHAYILGGMFAGHDEGTGKIVKSNGNKYIEFYGSSSDTANKKHYGGLSDYRSSEGRTVRVKYRGAIKDTIQNILGGLRSSCTYVGAPSLKQLSKCTTFVRVSNQFNDTFAD